MLSLPCQKRYNFFIDDNIFFFTDILRENFSSVFQHFYLDGLRKVHEKYGTVFTLNCFYHNYHEPEFDLSLFPDKYRSEFEDNSDWLKFAFHAYSEFPSAPYGKAYPEKLEEHYRLWEKEMLRIAGVNTLIAPVIVHCFDTLEPGRKFLREQGMKMYAVRKDGKFGYSGQFDQIEMPVDMFLNMYFSDIAGILNDLQQKISAGQQALLIGSHEQYAYLRYSNYIPEYFNGIDAVCRMLSENGYSSVYYSETIK